MDVGSNILTRTNDMFKNLLQLKSRQDVIIRDLEQTNVALQVEINRLKEVLEKSEKEKDEIISRVKSSPSQTSLLGGIRDTNTNTTTTATPPENPAPRTFWGNVSATTITKKVQSCFMFDFDDPMEDACLSDDEDDGDGGDAVVLDDAVNVLVENYKTQVATLEREKQSLMAELDRKQSDLTQTLSVLSMCRQELNTASVEVKQLRLQTQEQQQQQLTVSNRYGVTDDLNRLQLECEDTRRLKKDVEDVLFTCSRQLAEAQQEKSVQEAEGRCQYLKRMADMNQEIHRKEVERFLSSIHELRMQLVDRNIQLECVNTGDNSRPGSSGSGNGNSNGNGNGNALVTTDYNRTAQSQSIWDSRKRSFHLLDTHAADNTYTNGYINGFGNGGGVNGHGNGNGLGGNGYTNGYTNGHGNGHGHIETMPPREALRAGKWSTEEETYANRLVLEFSRGSLTDCAVGWSLRAYLSKKLNCVPMRISKKFPGKSFGKMNFVRKKVGDSTYMKQLEEELEATRQEWLAVANGDGRSSCDDIMEDASSDAESATLPLDESLTPTGGGGSSEGGFGCMSIDNYYFQQDTLQSSLEELDEIRSLFFEQQEQECKQEQHPAG
eukprot:gene349-626_t